MGTVIFKPSESTTILAKDIPHGQFARVVRPGCCDFFANDLVYRARDHIVRVCDGASDRAECLNVTTVRLLQPGESFTYTE